MSLNALLDLELDPFHEITDEVVQEGFYSKARTLVGDSSSNQNKSINMEQDTSASCELLLTDYLLNFGDETSNGVAFRLGSNAAVIMKIVLWPR